MRIMLVDDHAPTRTEVRSLLSADHGITVVAEAGNGEEAIRMAGEFLPDVIVMDIMMPGVNGIEATRRIVADHPEIKILALSNHAGDSLVQAVLKSGGAGYVRKNKAFEELIPALRCIAGGRTYTGPSEEPKHP